MNEICKIEKWSVFELKLDGPKEGNPFRDIDLSAAFHLGERKVEVDGFYDDQGVYKIRFMPDQEGEWRYETRSRQKSLDGQSGHFSCTAPRTGNHGPVLADGKHLFYADGTLYSGFGTTSYAWVHQGETLAETTLAHLKQSPFDKVRMTVFPKSYKYNEHNDPQHFVFPVRKRGKTSWDGNWDNKEGSDWDFDWERFDVSFFAMLEQRVEQLMDLGVQADIILFHPYDRWGLARMPQETDHFYLKYLIARLSAYRNVWWSLANEYDLMHAKSDANWEAIGQLIARHDAYHRLTGIHNCMRFFDHNRPWISHASIQTSQFDFSRWRQDYDKPIVIDEMCYEGNVNEGWGNISAMEMVHRFWQVAVQGGYPGHSEVYLTPEHVMWWNKGGKLRGESPRRIAFLRDLLESGPAEPVKACPQPCMSGLPCGQKGETWILGYTGVRQPIETEMNLPAHRRYLVQHIDVWSMKIEREDEIETGDGSPLTVAMTGKPYRAVLLTAIKG